MNKKGFALVFSFIVIAVLAILLGSVFLKTMNENNLVRRNSDSTAAFWLAEAAVTEALNAIKGVSFKDAALGRGRYNYTITSWKQIGLNDYYNITANGYLALASGGNIMRQISAVARTAVVDPDRFPYSLVSYGELCFGGGCNKDPGDYVYPQPDLSEFGVNNTTYPALSNCTTNTTTGDCFGENNTGVNFLNLFGYEANEIKALADHYYTDETFPTTGGGVDGITWVDVVGNKSVKLSGGGASDYDEPDGTGILIINGTFDFQVTGNYLFRGIIFVIGDLRATGNFTNFGTILVQDYTNLTESTVQGSPQLYQSKYDITSALWNLTEKTVELVSWRETTP